MMMVILASRWWRVSLPFAACYQEAPSVASTPAVGAAFNDVLAEKLDACKSVRDVNALYTKLYGASGIKAPADQIAMFSKRKDEVQND